MLAGLGAGMRHGLLWGVWGLGRPGCLALGASPGGATAFRGCGLWAESRGRLQACLTEPRPVLGAASSHLFTPRCFCRRDKRPGPETAAEPRQGNHSPGRGGHLEPPSTPPAPHGQRDQPGLGHCPAVHCPGPRGARPGRHALLPLRVAPPAAPAGLQPAARERPSPGPEAVGGAAASRAWEALGLAPPPLCSLLTTSAGDSGAGEMGCGGAPHWVRPRRWRRVAASPSSASRTFFRPGCSGRQQGLGRGSPQLLTH